MDKIRLIIWAATLFILSACGGSGDSGSEGNTNTQIDSAQFGEARFGTSKFK